MLKKDSNRLFQTLGREGFDPKHFALEQVGDEANRFVDQIVLKGTPLRFYIRQGPTFQKYDSKFTTFSPEYSLSDVTPSSGFFPIEKLETVFVDWLHKHAQPCITEYTEPDLWQQMQYEAPLVTGEMLSSGDIALFSDEEKRQIKMSINEFRVLVLKQFEPSTAELEIIDGRLNYLTEAVDRLNRTDWRSVAISAMVAISVALTLDTEAGRVLFDLFVKAFSSVAGFITQ